MRDAGVGDGGNESCVTYSQKTAASATAAQIITATSIKPCFHAQVSSLVSVYGCNTSLSVCLQASRMAVRPDEKEATHGLQRRNGICASEY